MNDRDAAETVTALETTIERLAKYQAGFSPLLNFLTNLGTFLILFLGGTDVLHGAITVGTFIAFQRFVVQLSWPMEAIGWAVTMSKRSNSVTVNAPNAP